MYAKSAKKSIARLQRGNMTCAPLRIVRADIYHEISEIAVCASAEFAGVFALFPAFVENVVRKKRAFGAVVYGKVADI